MKSLNGLLRASSVLGMDFGRINVVLQAPMSLKEYAENLGTEIESQRTQKFDPLNNKEDRKYPLFCSVLI